MRFPKFKEQWARTQLKNIRLEMVVVIQATVILILLGGLFSRNTVVVVSPPSLTAKAEIGKDSGNKDYLQQMALVFAELVGNLTPKNGQFVLQTILSYCDAAIYKSVQAQLLDAITAVEKSASTRSFFPESIIHEEGVWYVTGNSQHRDDVSSISTQRVTVELQLDVHNYRVRIRHISMYDGGPKPRKNTGA